MKRFEVFHGWHWGAIILDHKQLRACISYVAVLFLFCVPAYTQQQVEKQRVAREEGVRDHRVGEPSDLSQENLSRVAASADQLKEVLVKDAGILVELKRWVAKEATDNGQIVEDSSLTDRTIFDRLERDIAFRSVATRLVQRYGHLLPSINPDSELGKQQDLLLKERVRRLAQKEAQEDAESLRPSQGEANEARRAKSRECDPQRDDACGEASSNRTRLGSPRPEETPGIEPSLPVMPSPTSPSSGTRTLRASLGRGDSSLQGGSESEASQTALLDSLRRSADGFGSSSPLGPLDGLPNQARSNGLQNLAALSPSLSRNEGGDGSVTEKGMGRSERFSEQRRLPVDRNLPPVSMVRRPSPYADVPSLY